MTSRTRVWLCVLSLMLCAWPVIPGADPAPWIDRFARSGSHFKEVVACVVGLPLMLVRAFSFMIGSCTLAMMAWSRLKQGAVGRGRLQPILFPLLSVILVAAQALPFVTVPPGTSIRPMAWAAYVLAGALGLAVVSVVRTISEFRRGANKLVCFAALLLSLATVAMPTLSLHAIAIIKGFSLSP
jgi:hypothetical protein